MQKTTSRKPPFDNAHGRQSETAEKLRRLRELQTENFKTILEENAALLAFCTEVIRDYSALLDKHESQRTAMKALRAEYVLLKSRRNKLERRAEADAVLQAAEAATEEADPDAPLSEEMRSGE